MLNLNKWNLQSRHLLISNPLLSVVQDALCEKPIQQSKDMNIG